MEDFSRRAQSLRFSNYFSPPFADVSITPPPLKKDAKKVVIAVKCLMEKFFFKSFSGDTFPDQFNTG